MVKSPQKTILIATHQGFTTRYLLQTDIFRFLKSYGNRVVILSPNSTDESFRADYGSAQVSIEQFNYEAINKVRQKKLYAFFIQIKRFIFPGGCDCATLHDKERVIRYRVKHLPWINRIGALMPLWIAFLLRKSGMLRKIFLGLESLVFFKEYHAAVFNRYKPDMLILADLGTIDISNFLMYEARKRRIPILSMILSWDNLTAKGIGSFKPDYAVAWNANMRQELIAYHGVSPQNIFVGGVPHFDGYFRKDGVMPEENFREIFSLHKTEKIIFYGTASPSSFKENERMVLLLADGIRNKKFSFPAKLIVRLHPAYFMRKKNAHNDEFASIEKISREHSDIVRLNFPKLIPRTVGFELPIQDQYLLGSILRYSNILITQFSTLMLEAAIFDTPIVNIGFDNFRNIEMKSSELYWRNHLRRVLETGFARTAETEKELIDLINLYVRDPQLDSEKRKLICEQECSVYAGKAGETIASYIQLLLSEM